MKKTKPVKFLENLIVEMKLRGKSCDCCKGCSYTTSPTNRDMAKKHNVCFDWRERTLNNLNIEDVPLTFSYINKIQTPKGVASAKFDLLS
jgi:hypothetical protein